MKNVRCPVVLKKREQPERAVVGVVKFSVLAAAHHECSTHDWATNGGQGVPEKGQRRVSVLALLPALRAVIYLGR